MRFKSTLSYQQTGALTEVDSADYDDNLFIPWYRSDQSENKFSFSTQFRHKVTAKDNYSVGIIADFYSIDYRDSVFSQDLGHFRTLTDVSGDLYLLRAYAQWQHKFNDQITTYAGLHSQYFGMNNELAVEPRLSLRWQINSKQSVNAGFGMHSQLQPKVVYYYQAYDSLTNTYSRTNEDVKFTKSIHYTLTKMYCKILLIQ